MLRNSNRSILMFAHASVTYCLFDGTDSTLYTSGAVDGMIKGWDIRAMSTSRKRTFSFSFSSSSSSSSLTSSESESESEKANPVGRLRAIIDRSSSDSSSSDSSDEEEDVSLFDFAT